MAAATKKIRRRRGAGELAVEQARDFEEIERLLESAGLPAGSLIAGASCYLVAYVGEKATGFAALEARVDTALISSLIAAGPSGRRDDICAALIAAARTAAHTRGARTLYASAIDDSCCGWLAAAGFTPIAADQMIEAMGRSTMTGHLQQLHGDRSRIQIWMLDISNDGVIER